MTVKLAQPDDSNECFGHYGNKRDVLDMALHYGHLDLSIPFAQCAPIDTELQDGSRLRIVAQQPDGATFALGAPKVTMDEDGLILSHICFDFLDPGRAKTMLLLALQASLKRKGHPKSEIFRLATQAVDLVKDENHRLLSTLAHSAESIDHPGGAVLAGAARRQSDIICKALA